jgi:hypothetical protein
MDLNWGLTVTMAAIAVSRVVSEERRRDDAKLRLAHYLRNAVDLLEKQAYGALRLGHHSGQGRHRGAPR